MTNQAGNDHSPVLDMVKVYDQSCVYLFRESQFFSINKAFCDNRSLSSNNECLVSKRNKQNEPKPNALVRNKGKDSKESTNTGGKGLKKKNKPSTGI